MHSVNLRNSTSKKKPNVKNRDTIGSKVPLKDFLLRKSNKLGHWIELKYSLTFLQQCFARYLLPHGHGSSTSITSWNFGVFKMASYKASCKSVILQKTIFSSKIQNSRHSALIISTDFGHYIPDKTRKKVMQSERVRSR